jgi:hypothetical protein
MFSQVAVPPPAVGRGEKVEYEVDGRMGGLRSRACHVFLL